MRRVTLPKIGLTAAIALIALVLVVGMIVPGLAGHAAPVRAAASPHLAVQSHPPATGPVSIASSYTSNFSTNSLPYFTLPYNITWNVTLTNATIDSNFSQVINVTWLQSGCGPFTFPCNQIYSSAVNPAWGHISGSKGAYWFPLSLANLTGAKYLGFDFPQGQWQFGIYSNYDDGIGHAAHLELDQAAFMAITGPAGSISQPIANSNLTAGHTVIAGEYSGYFVATANVTVYNSTGFTVLTAPVYAPGYGQHAFGVAWPAITPGAYSVVLTLTAVWHQVFKVSVTVTVVPAVPLTYLNTTSLIPGLGNGGSAALLITVGAIIGMIVMALVGRGMFGGTKPAPAAQPWSSQSTTTTTSGTTGTTGGTGGSSDMSGSSSSDMSKPPT